MEGFSAVEIAGMEGILGPIGLAHVCLAIMMLVVIGLLFLVKYIISV